MNWAKVRRIIRREYLDSVQKKSFLFGLLFTPLLMLGMIALPLLSASFLSSDSLVLGIRGGHGELAAALARTEWTGPPARPDFALYDAAKVTPAEMDARVLSGELTGWIDLPADVAETGKFSYRSESVTNVAMLPQLERRVEEQLAKLHADRLGLSAADTELLLQPGEMSTVQLGAAGEAETDFGAVYLKAVGLVMVLFFALIPASRILMRSVIEEKSNRVIEILLSSVSPLELMVGKVVGLGLVGLTLLAAWATTGGLLSWRFGRELPISLDEMGVFFAFFLPGYFLFAGVLGAVGSLCRAEREAQPFVTPLTLIVMLPVMFGFAIAQNPDHLIARILTFFPPLTPSLVMFRNAVKPLATVELAAAWLVLTLATIGTLILAARVFRLGILMTGKRPTWPELARWLRAS